MREHKARDALAWSLQNVKAEGYTDMVMTIHDEIVIEVPQQDADKHLENIQNIMGREIPWMKGLPLRADGYVTPYYKKD